MSMRYRTASVLAVALALLGGISSAEDVSEGRVRFYNIADSDFDRYSKAPGDSEQQWMRETYIRMQTYTPYFDRRLDWYPNAWVYKDSYSIKPHWQIFREHPEWVLRDADGNMLFIPWGCRDGSCPQYAADLGNPAFRANWIAEAKRLVELGYRGIWVDDVNLTWRVSDGDGEHVRPINPRTGEPMTLPEWRENFAVFMEEIRAAFPAIEIAHNSIWYAVPFDDPVLTRQIDAADFINLERGASDPGLTDGDGKWSFERFLAFIDLVQSRDRAAVLMDYGKTPAQRMFGLAAWFLISRGQDMIASNQLEWSAPDAFWRGYALDLGPATSERFRWRGMWRRDFRCGTALLNPPGGWTQQLSMPSGYRRIGGEPAGNLRVKGREAVVLLRDCESASDAGGAQSRSAPSNSEPQ